MTSTTSPDRSVAERLSAEHGPALTLGDSCTLPDDLVVEIAPGAHLTIGDRVSIGRGCTIQVHRGATVAIGDDVSMGECIFVSAMAGIRLGDGCTLSSTVDLRDHTRRPVAHPPGGQSVPWTSGFEAAPIIIEAGAILSPKVTVTAGVRIGANARVGANTVVSYSIAPDAVDTGVPAGTRRTVEGAPAPRDDVRTLSVGFFGTSIMEHLEAFNSRMTTQADLPEPGSRVTVEGWHSRGWVHRLALSLRAAWPYVTFDVKNHGEGGATSRDIAGIVDNALTVDGFGYDLVFLGCGINDVWRRFQGRTAEAVGLDEYTRHFTTMLNQLSGHARQIIVVSETPFGPIDAPATVGEMNGELARYNEAAATTAVGHGALFLNVWTPFAAAARNLAPAAAADDPVSLWSDGVHLTELGDTVLLQQAERILVEHRIIEKLLDYPLLEREAALTAYGPLFARFRPTSS
ncbi:GDSL-type esterase/lipase family protein [Streptomyces graminilatus]|uniref:GDSL-type esterase/lipase family protein n=1 Tax=Streptomyces graminilatus TaxID=1464070 RepID=UPI0006E13858|nr:GDSL-type esterase/lipase family protein [Streptomyces graminilatus]